ILGKLLRERQAMHLSTQRGHGTFFADCRMPDHPHASVNFKVCRVQNVKNHFHQASIPTSYPTIYRHHRSSLSPSSHLPDISSRRSEPCWPPSKAASQRTPGGQAPSSDAAFHRRRQYCRPRYTVPREKKGHPTRTVSIAIAARATSLF